MGCTKVGVMEWWTRTRRGCDSITEAEGRGV